MNNSSQTQHRRSETKRKEEQKTKENEAQKILVTTCEIAPARYYLSCHCSHFSTVHLHFTLLLFLLQFFCFFPFYHCNSFWFCFFFLVISYTLSTYISLGLYKLSKKSLLAIDSGRQFARCFPLSLFSFIFFPLSRQPNTL